MTEPCIACEVLAPILEARAAWLRRKIRPFIRSHEWLAAGLGLRLAYSPRVLGLVSELIQVEAESCPFLRFEMRTRPGPLSWSWTSSGRQELADSLSR